MPKSAKRACPSGKEDHVVRLDVAVNDPHLVGVGKRVEQLLGVRHRGLRAEAIVQAVGERLLAKRRRDDEVAVDHHRVAEREDVLVLEPRGQPHLAVDGAQGVFVELIEVGNLERDGDPLDRVVRLVDGRKRPGPNSAPDAVLAEHPASLEGLIRARAARALKNVRFHGSTLRTSYGLP